ncbi:MAG: nucleotidyltransferase family protein [Oscillospiraceae bacterium]|nr:nucleotidyltransferase family protein [Oscillospiraceae bacterium]
MKTAAVICEYNPFHNGHKFQLEQTRKLGATHIVAVMSGNFTQRGDVAVFDKYIRTKTALENGADLVLELPVKYSLCAAEGFARGAVGIIAKLGCVDMLSFGSECGDIAALREAAGAVEYALKTPEFQLLIGGGKNYPAALAEAVNKYYTEDVYQTICSPNNTLAVEYIKALDDIGSSIEPVTVRREGADHDSDEEAHQYISASLIRKKILSGESYADFAPVINAPTADIRRLEPAILAKLRSMKPEDFEQVYDAAQGLSERLYKAVRKACSLEELYFLAKTKRYTLARIRRAVLCAFLGVEKKMLHEQDAYIHILGMNSKGKEILSAAKNAQCPLPLDTSLRALMNTSREAHRQGAFEARCGDIYSLAFEKPRPCGTDFTAKPVIIE